MFYECSCGFTAATATAFYKHLAASKESGTGHQLTQARFSEKSAKAKKKSADAYEAAEGSTAAASAPASWVDEYLLVDQRDTSGTAAPWSHTQPPVAEVPLPVSTAAPMTSQQQPSQAGGDLDDVPLRELQGMTKVWSLGRQRSSSAGRPPLPTSTSSSTRVSAGPQSMEPLLVDIDEVELIERNTEPQPSNADVANRDVGAGAGGTTAQAALRMSGTVVNAMVVGLSPWRWFGSGAPNGAAPEPGLDGQPTGAGASRGEEVLVSADGGGAEFSPAETSLTGGLDDVHGANASWGQPAPSLDAVHAVRDVLIWRNPWRTGRIFSAGLYLAVCARQLTQGHDLLQPSTAIFALCFLLLLRNVVREAVANYRRAQQMGAQEGKGEAGGQFAEAPTPSQAPWDEEQVARREAAMQLQQRVEAVLLPMALGAARYGASLVVLGVGLLSGRRATTSALVAGLLWLGMVVGELRVMSQPMFWLLCYIAAFSIPAAYYRCRRAMDAGVEAALRFAVRVLVSGSRTALLMAGSVAAVLVAVLPLNIVLRASLAAGAAFGVLLWQSEPATLGAPAGKWTGAGQAQLCSETDEGAGGSAASMDGGARLVSSGGDYQHRE